MTAEYKNAVLTSFLVWWVALAAGITLLGNAGVQATTVTVWEDQFTSIDPGWSITAGTTFVSQAIPGGVSGSEDGFEAAFNNPSGFARYAIFTIPANLVQAGDIVEYSIRSNSGVAPTKDRVNLVGGAGSAFDSLFVSHGTSNGLTYQQEAGTLFNVAQTTLSQGLRNSSNLLLGNNRPGGSGVDAIFYIDYIRIIGDRPDPARNWNQNSSGDWNDDNNWAEGNAPNSNISAAIFGSVVSGPATVYTDTLVKVKGVTFDSLQGFAIAGPGSVVLEANAGKATIDVQQAATNGTHQFQVKVSLNSTIDVSTVASASLKFNNVVALNNNNVNITAGSHVFFNSSIDDASGGTVSNFGTLGGGGRINGNVSNQPGGTVAPGNELGKLIVDGNYTQDPLATLAIEIAGTSSSKIDLLDISGTATLKGAINLSLLSFVPTSGSSFTVLRAAGGIVDNGILLTGDSANFTKSIVGNSLILSFQAVDKADFDNSGVVDGRDFLIWQRGFGAGTTFAEGDANNSGTVDSADLAIWQNQYGTVPLSAVSSVVPEPSALVVLTLGSVLLVARNRFVLR